MAALNFPASPTAGQIYAPGSGLPSFQWNGAAWINIGTGMVVDVFTYTASGGETTVPVTGGYLANLGIVARNGAMQAPGDDVDISSGTGITFATSLIALESIVFYKFRAFSLFDALTKSQNLADLPDKAMARASLEVPYELIEQRSPTLGQTEIDFTNLPAGFSRFVLEIDSIGVATADSNVLLRVQTAGTTWQTGTVYNYNGIYYGTGSASHFSSTIDGLPSGIPTTFTTVGNKVGNATGHSLSARIEFNAKNTNTRRRFRINSDYTRPDGSDVGITCIGTYASADPITGVRLTSTSSQFKGQGNVKLFGIRS